MNTKTHSQLTNFIWSICNLLRGPYTAKTDVDLILGASR